jgi:2-hydroxychromene-2-carboxylate isomerase
MHADNNRVVQFYFDPVSPYAWLASKQLDRLIKAGLTIDCRPLLFAGLLSAHEQKGPAEIPAKRTYVFGDVLREASRHGYAFNGPPTHPYNPLRALRMCIVLEQPEERLVFAQALLSACWGEGKDLSSPDVLDRIADDCGFAAWKLGAAAEQAEIKNKLIVATNDAIAAGIFGVPTFCFNGELFWGSDRIDALLWRVDHPDEGDAKLKDFLQRKASAQRVT